MSLDVRLVLTLPLASDVNQLNDYEIDINLTTELRFWLYFILQSDTLTLLISLMFFLVNHMPYFLFFKKLFSQNV
jgi:hypothetical protein